MPILTIFDAMKWKYLLLFVCTAFFITAFIKAINKHSDKQQWITGTLDSSKPVIDKKTTNKQPDNNTPYNLIYESVDSIKASAGTKSVLFNSNGSRLYAMNLEGLSVYEFDSKSRNLIRTFRFKSTRGKGWDYELRKVIPSLQEKPVEACLSHNDKILWVSLHNAGGVVPIYLDSFYSNNIPWIDTNGTKKIIVHNLVTARYDSVIMPLIHTGLTPKVIAKTANDKFLLVSNWHSQTVSVVGMEKEESPVGTFIKNIPVAAIPRGIVVDDANQKTYIAIMGSSYISVLNNNGWMKEKNIPVASNPRHIVMDKKGRLYVSFNILGQIACIDPSSGKTLFTANTAKQPRTIALSKDGKYLFVTCYASNKMEVYKIEDNQFTQLYSLPCFGKPVGADVVETKDKTEVWVCNYVKGNIKIFTFNKQPI